MVRSTLRCGALTLGCVLASAFVSTAVAQLLNHKDLSASMAITIAQTAIETCKATVTPCRRPWSAATARSSCRCAATTRPAHHREQHAQGLHRAHVPVAVWSAGGALKGRSDAWPDSPPRLGMATPRLRLMTGHRSLCSSCFTRTVLPPVFNYEIG